MEVLNICYSLDSDYTEQLLVSMASVLKNSREDENLNFVILYDILSDEIKASVNYLQHIKNFTVKYVKVNSDDFSQCPLLKNTKPEYSNYHVSLPTYYKFKLNDYVKNINKILYLDCDTIVKSSLSELFDIDMKNVSALSVKDVETVKEAQRLGLKDYYNAGVMLINLDYWKENDIQTKLFDAAKSFSDKILWQDQDILNLVLSDSVKEISCEWNYQYFLYENKNGQMLSNSKILHLAGKFKPWLDCFEHPVFDIYYDYLSLTDRRKNIDVYKNNAYGKRLAHYFPDNGIVVGKIATEFDIWEANKNAEHILNAATHSLYDEISKNYGYIDKVNSQTKEEFLNHLNQLKLNINECFANVYDNISKNSKFYDSYILQSNEKINFEFDKKLENLSSELSNNLTNDIKSSLTIDTDAKINDVYNEIHNNYEFTKELVSNTRKEVELNAGCRFDDFTAKLDELSLSFSNLYIPDINPDEFNEIKSAYNALLVKIREIPSLSSDETDKKLDLVYAEIRRTSEYLKSRIYELTSQNASDLTSKVDEIYEELNRNLSLFQDKYSLSLSQLKSEADEQNLIIKNELNNYIDKNSKDLISLKTSLLNKDASDFDLINQKIDLLNTDYQTKFAETNNYFNTNVINLKTDLEQLVFEKESDFTKKINETEQKFSDEATKLMSLIDSANSSNTGEILRIDNRIIQTEKTVSENYDEINQKLIQNIDYTNNLINGINRNIDEYRTETSQIISEITDKFYATVSFSEKNIDSKISGINDSLSFKIGAAEQKFNKTINEKINDISDKVTAADEVLKNQLRSYTDTSVIGLKSEYIDSKAELYEYSNNLAENLYADLNAGFQALKENLDYKLKEVYSESELSKSQILHLESSLKSKADLSLKSEIDALVNKVREDVELKTRSEIAELKNSFETAINNQRIRYEQKLIALENDLYLIRESLENKNKNSPFLILSDKYRNVCKKIQNKLKRVK